MYHFNKIGRGATSTYCPKHTKPEWGRAAKLGKAMTMNMCPNAHTHQRFHDHFVVVKVLGGYYQGCNLGVS